MKPILTLCCAATLALLSCSGRGSTSDAVSRAAARCPIPVENVGFISSISLHTDTLVYICNVTEQGVNIPSLATHTDAMKRAMAPTITTLFDNDPALLDELREKKWILSVRYRDTRGGALTLDFTPGELSGEATASRTIDPEQRLADEISLSRSSLPAQMADAIVIRDIVDRDGYVVFECSVDEDIAGSDAMTDLRRNIPAIRASMREALGAEGDTDVERLVDVTTTAGRGIAYRYTGTVTGDTLSIAFTSDELRR